MEDTDMKKDYMKPAMRVVQLQQQHIICSSPDGYAKGVSNSKGIDWKDGGFGDQDGDY